LRQFNVLINGNQVLKKLRHLCICGESTSQTVESFLATADNTGTITIQFVPGSADNPQVNGIEIGVGSIATLARNNSLTTTPDEHGR